MEVGEGDGEVHVGQNVTHVVEYHTVVLIKAKMQIFEPISQVAMT